MLDLILCVDDDPITLMLCKMVISKSAFSHEIATATNGQGALQYFEDLKSSDASKPVSKYPKMVFLDLNMPVMGGWEFLDEFSKPEFNDYFPETKVIVLSSTIDPKDIAKSRTYPMVLDFMPKPITKEMLEDLKKVI